MRAAIATLLLLASASPAQAQEILEYAVRDGETCGVIARRMYGHSRRYDLIHEHNPELGPMPHRLRAGQILRLPQVEVSDRSDATVTSVRRRVESQRPQAPDWDRARVGQELYQGWRVSTGERSSAELTFRESSVATIREETLVIVYGGEARRVRREGARAVIRQGAVLSRLSALSGGAEPLEIETPTAVASLGAGESSVHVERRGETRVASHRGAAARVRSRSGQGEIEVPEGHGTFVAEGRAPTPPRRLPSAPRWVVDQPVRYLAIRERGGSLAGAWQPINTASQYRVELARRPDGRDLMISTVVPSSVTRFELHRLPPGTYYARVCTIDEEGFEGRPPDAKAFTLVGVDVIEPGREPPPPEATEHPELDALDGVGDVDFAADVPERIPVLQGSRVQAPEGVVCAAGESAPANELVLDALGDVYLTCVDPEGQNIVGLELTIAALRMRVLDADGSESPVLFRDRVTAVRIEVEGVALDDVQLASGAGLAIVEAAPRPGGFSARVRAAADAPAQGELRLERGGATLTSAAVATSDAPIPAAPAEPPPRAVHEGLGRAAFASAVGVVDERRHGHAIWTGLHLQTARLGEPDVRLRTTAGLRVSLLEERLRVGAQVPLDIIGQGARVADRGERDVQLTVGSLILDEGAVGLAAEAGLWIPTAGAQVQGLRHARLQIAGDLSLRFAERLTLRTRQALIVDFAADESVLWASAYGLDVWLAGPLSIGVEGTMTIGREDNADWYTGGVGLALGLDVAPVFISLVGRYGFGDDLLTTFTLGTTVRGSFDE